MSMLALVAALAALHPRPAGDTITAAPPPPPPRTVTAEAAVAYDHLSGGRDPWRELRGRVAARQAPRTSLFAEARETRRFGAADAEAGLGATHGLGERWTVAVEGTASPSHRVLPRWSGSAAIARALGGGWGVELGGQRREYDAASVQSGRVTVAREWRAARAAYTLNRAALRGAGAVAVHAAQLTRAFGDRASVTLGAAAGREAESLGAAGVLVTNVRSAAVWGRVRAAPRVDVTYAVGRHVQGALYTRTQAQLGLSARRW